MKAINFTKHIHYYLFGIIMVVSIISCERDMKLEIKTNDKRLLVEGEFTNDSVYHTIKLHRSGSLITGQPQLTVSGALIYITDNVDTFLYAESNIHGLYKTVEKCSGKGGHTYHLSITNVDIDEDGNFESYTVAGTMPVPVVYDSLIIKREIYFGEEAVINRAWYNVAYNGADYIYVFAMTNGYVDYGTITDRLGTREIIRSANELKVPKLSNPDEIITQYGYQAILEPVKSGDTISFIGFNFTQKQYSFLMEFDNQTTRDDAFQDNIYDELKIPSNLPTNIEPSNNAAGYFFIYSKSGIDKIFEESSF